MLKYQIPFEVHKSEVTPCGALKSFHILNTLQNAADGAVQAMNPPEEYWNCGCGWMLHQYTLRLDHPLALGDKGIINTGHQLQRDLYSMRRFVLIDEAGKQFGVADSMWVFVDLAARRPVRLSRRLPQSFITCAEDSSAFTPEFVKPLPLERVDNTTPLHVRLGELDMNGHVNNAYYLSWAAEGVPYDVYMSCGIVEFDILFKHEAVYGMDLVITTQRDDLSFRHEIHSDKGDLIAQLSTRWAPVGK